MSLRLAIARMARRASSFPRRINCPAFIVAFVAEERSDDVSRGLGFPVGAVTAQSSGASLRPPAFGGYNAANFAFHMKAGWAA
jgi:hypothetical protein